MNNNFSINDQRILDSFTAEQWRAIAAYATKMAERKSFNSNPEEKREPANPEENRDHANKTLSGEKLYTEVTKMLHHLGVPAHIKGYKYIRDAVVMVYQDWNCVEQVTKVLYPELARKHNTTSSRVERAIRHAIECAFDRVDLQYLEIYNITYSPGRGKTTNSEFIAAVADYLKQYGRS